MTIGSLQILVHVCAPRCETLSGGSWNSALTNSPPTLDEPRTMSRLWGTQWVSSVAQPCPILFDPMDCSRPGLPVHHQLPEFAQTHVYWVSDAIQPSHPLSSPSYAFDLFQHQGLFQWVSEGPSMCINYDIIVTWRKKNISYLLEIHARFHRDKESAYNAGDTSLIPGLGEDSLEEEMAACFGILTWKSPWTEEPGALQSMGSQRVRHDWVHMLIYLWMQWHPEKWLRDKGAGPSPVGFPSVSSGYPPSHMTGSWETYLTPHHCHPWGPAGWEVHSIFCHLLWAVVWFPFLATSLFSVGFWGHRHNSNNQTLLGCIHK